MNTGKYDALDVANYIVNYCIENDSPVSNLKLQKLLYYVQAASLVKMSGRPMFQDDICAWTYGPVVEDVYHEFKSYANMVIDDYIDGRFIDCGFAYDDSYAPERIIDEQDGALVKKVVDSYREMSPLEMVRKTHRESPWKDAYDRNEAVISTEAIEQYYLKNRSLIYGK